jgi:hypothetical protein
MNSIPFYMEGMDRTIKMEKYHIEAWGLWWLEWQQWTKERLRRHTMSTQTRLKEFEARHLSGTIDNVVNNSNFPSISQGE